MSVDSSKMRYDPDRIPKGVSVIDFYKDLAEYTEFAGVEDDQLIRISLYATEQESPFVKLEREDYEKRLVKIFEHLKIKNADLLSAISLGSNQAYENMVNRIYMMSDNLAYVMWSNKLRMFHYISISLRKAPDMSNIVSDMTKRASLDNQLKTIYNDLVEYEALVFTDIPTRNKIRKQLAKLLQPAEEFAIDKTVV